MTQKTKGSAEVAPSKPSQTSNHTTGIKNMGTDNTRKFRDQVMDMESPIEDIINSSSLLFRLLDDCFGRSHIGITGHADVYRTTKVEVSDMYFIAGLIGDKVKMLKGQWETALETKQ
jgi:hypothetical protein